MTNYLSIDFESWAYPNLPEFKKLDSEKRKRLDAGYVEMSAAKILPLLRKYKTKLTFFVLGQLYDWYPETIEKIAQEGHEIAYHTYTHDLVDSEKKLIDSLEKSKKFFKKFKPKGFRAPNVMFKKEYFKILKDYGFCYDSSFYGPYSLRKTIDGFDEIPVSTFFHLPVGSGYFLATLRRNIGWFYNKINKKPDPVVAFIHNWQIVKPVDAVFPTRNYILGHPYYLPYTFQIYDTFEYLLKNFSFAPMINLIQKER